MNATKVYENKKEQRINLDTKIVEKLVREKTPQLNLEDQTGGFQRFSCQHCAERPRETSIK